MDTGWLQDFVTLAQVNNFTRAAEIRHSSQAAFSRRIRALEAWVGAELIDRSVFPTRLTEEGSRFLEHALEIVRRVADARIDMADRPSGYRSMIRIAAPHALATGMLPQWWHDWTQRLPAIGCTVNPVNVHDAVTSLVAGNADLLVCFHNPQQPIHLDTAQYERLTLCAQSLRPYAAPTLLAQRRWTFPGSTQRPMPVLAYSPGAYLARMTDLILDNAPQPPVMERQAESDMADVLREMAIAGHGIAWLPDCVAQRALDAGLLVSISEEPRWTLRLSVMAYRDTTNDRPGVGRLWNRLRSLYESTASHSA